MKKKLLIPFISIDKHQRRRWIFFQFLGSRGDKCASSSSLKSIKSISRMEFLREKKNSSREQWGTAQEVFGLELSIFLLTKNAKCIKMCARDDIEEYRIFFLSSLFSTLLFSPPPWLRLFFGILHQTVCYEQGNVKDFVTKGKARRVHNKMQSKIIRDLWTFIKRILHKLYTHTIECIHRGQRARKI